MATVRQFWRCGCRDESGKQRGYKKVRTGKKGEVAPECKWCHAAMYAADGQIARVMVNGKSRYAASSRKADGDAFIRECQTAKRNKTLLPGEEERIPWKTAIKKFEGWLETSGLGERTISSFYKPRLSSLTESFADYDLQDITVGIVDDHKSRRINGKAAPKTVRHDIQVLKRIFNLYTTWVPADKAPKLHARATDLRLFRLKKGFGKEKRVRYLAEKEIQLLLQECKPRDKRDATHLHLVVMIALSTGLRRGNILNLRWNQFDLKAGTITFRPKDMKGGRAFILALDSELVEDLKAWRKKDEISPLVFPAPRKNGKVTREPIETIKTAYNNAVTRAKLNPAGVDRLEKVVFHTLRHTFAAHFLMNGGDLATLSEILDHASIQITKDTYGHLAHEHKKAAIQAFASGFLRPLLNGNGNDDGNKVVSQ